MAVFQSDLLGRSIQVLGKISQAAMATTGTLTLFNTPPAPPGSSFRTFVLAIVLDNPTGASGTLTASAGSGSTATDFVTSGSVAVPTSAGTPTTILYAVSTGIIYASGLAFNFKITAGGVGACDITALGWTE